ncbi:MAG: hypothetical protein KC912_18335 [Proteobacteria bacterium]|nr:hypothetical protein [Pseudomonadota bacterium]
MLSLLLVAALAQEPVSVEAVEPSTESSTETAEPEVPEGWTRLEVETVPAVEVVEPEVETPAGEPAPEEASSDREIIVWGEGAIRHAREAIVRSVEDMGYKTLRRKKDGTVVLKAPATWQGRLRIKDGMMDFGRPAVALWLHKPEEESSYDSTRVLEGKDMQDSTGLRFVVLPSGRRLAAVHERVLEGSRDEVLYYRDVVQRTASEEVLFAIPQRLDALWADGTPLDQAPDALQSFEDRRAHVLAFWASRAETSEGERVCEAIEAWLEATVQESDHPLTADEISTAEEAAGRSLGL